MKHWFTSDYHLGHKNIIAYCNRPFKTLEQMNETIIRNHNSRVKPEDTVFHIGDFCFRNTQDSKGEGVRISSAEWEAKLNGKIIHIRGNHDKNNSTKTIVNGVLAEYGNHKFYMVHKPEHYNSNYTLNLVGHVHDRWTLKKAHDSCILFNVGVDAHNFMPIKFEEILKQIKFATT